MEEYYMAVNSITQINTTETIRTNDTLKNTAKNTAEQTTVNTATESKAAVYEKSGTVTSDTKKTHHYDKATVEQMKADAEARTQQLRSLVEKMLLKQGQVLQDSDNFYSMLREGKISVDAETAAQAKEDISEDGYWGVKQTSERMVSFAKALAGNDPSKADTLIAAVKKGFGEAEKIWGGELPDICKQTLDKTVADLEAWRDGLDVTENV